MLSPLGCPNYEFEWQECSCRTGAPWIFEFKIGKNPSYGFKWQGDSHWIGTSWIFKFRKRKDPNDQFKWKGTPIEHELFGSLDLETLEKEISHHIVREIATQDAIEKARSFLTRTQIRNWNHQAWRRMLKTQGQEGSDPYYEATSYLNARLFNLE